MATDGLPVDWDEQLSRRGKPWLLPFNRKLRHLQGISVRNIALPVDSSQPRRHSIDDDVLPKARQSPSKQTSHRETKKLEHSRSSLSLKPIHESSFQNGELIRPEQHVSPPSKESLKKHRRRSSVHWTDGAPQVRQRKLEDVATGRLVDSFFSLHIKDLDKPLYVSEVVDRAMNPDFRFFDLNGCDSSIIRQNEFTVKVWARNESMHEYQFLIDWTVEMPRLQYIGKTLESFDKSLSTNCVLFHLEDGIYTSFTTFPQVKLPMDFASESQKPQVSKSAATASYETLMRLANLDDCIQDALMTREKLTAEINEILDKHEDSFTIQNEVGMSHESLESTKRAVEAENRLSTAARRKRDNLMDSIRARRDAIEKGRNLDETARLSMQEGGIRMHKRKEARHQVDEDTTGQRRRICEDLVAIYPIESIPNRPLAFNIRGLYLPNSENLENADTDVVAAALGHAAQVIHLLSFYLSVPLPYPVQPYASRSTVSDPISIIKGNESREFPLYVKGAVRYRFEYGVFLLNKDIEILLNRFGLRIMDIRQTLPNLKYLLYVATAGKGELPARKAGGVRGLLRSGSGASTPTPSSRRGSGGSGTSDENAQLNNSKNLVGDVVNGRVTASGKGLQRAAIGSLHGSLQKSATTQSSRLRDVSR
ncbi:MAG: hypothetical protein M1821_000167 [Bathelium mastoideum]|nr:MAG: hypothetical protein M1821_000167 [Bathelium mastoideum]KAI9687799.1 MAG: hypothetical protein M1822_001879 [Bathelium mastoideum]